MKGYFIPPANEVWGKVMFLHLSVSHSVQGGSLYDVTSCLAAWSHVPSGGGLCLWSHVPSRRGLCPGGSLCLGVFSVQRSLSGREFLSGRPPPYGEERAVRILLECFLLLSYFSMAAIIPDFRLICLRFSKDRSLGQCSMRKPQAHRHTSVCTILS